MDIDIDFSGSISETIIFPRSPEILQANLDAASEFINSMGAPVETDPVRVRQGSNHNWRGASYWSGIPAAEVIGFLKEYQTHQESWKVNAQQLAEFVSRKSELGELTDWDVALLSGDSETSHSFADVATRLMTRKPRARRESDKTQAVRKMAEQAVRFLVGAMNGTHEKMEPSSERHAITQIREQWPDVKIELRADSGFCRDELMSWCEANDVGYVFGLAKNARFLEQSGAAIAEARRRSEATGKANRDAGRLSLYLRCHWFAGAAGASARCIGSGLGCGWRIIQNQRRK